MIITIPINENSDNITDIEHDNMTPKETRTTSKSQLKEISNPSSDIGPPEKGKGNGNKYPK